MLCKCGCGTDIPRKPGKGRPQEYVKGHRRELELAYHRQYYINVLRPVRLKPKVEKVCPECGKIHVRIKYCCAECCRDAIGRRRRMKESRDPRYAEHERLRNYNRYHEHKKKGLCVNCSRPAEHGVHCIPCYNRMAAYVYGR